MSFTYKYPRPCVTTDNLIFRKIDGNWHLLLIERGNEPFKGCWALPGGELQEETGMTGIELHQLYAFGAPNRDPRHRTISVAYWGVDNSERQAVGSDDAAEARWFALDKLPSLAFDHEQILQKALSDNEVNKVLTR